MLPRHDTIETVGVVRTFSKKSFDTASRGVYEVLAASCLDAVGESLKLEEFRAALSSVPPTERDAWLDAFFGLDHLPIDSELPRGCVPYMPCSVDVLLRTVEHANVQESDVFVDIGSGVGRAAVFVQLVTGASVIGVEIQSQLAAASRELAARVNVSRFSVIEGDAAELASAMTSGTVFFLYCPFSGDRLERVLHDLEAIARTKEIRVCTVDLPLPPRSWLTLVSPPARDLAVYRSTFSVEGSIHGA